MNKNYVGTYGVIKENGGGGGEILFIQELKEKEIYFFQY